MILAGIVLYNPDKKRLKQNIKSISTQVDKLILIDNNSDNIEEIEEMIMKNYCKINIIKNAKNKGVAYALNQILNYADTNNYEWFLTLDQDSIVKKGLISRYKKYIKEENIAMITCEIEDRNFKKEIKDNYEKKEIDKCITSGALNKKIGGYDNKMFIDSVDFDICATIKEKKYKIIRVNYDGLLHEVGHANVRRFLWKKVIIYNHMPFRTYYIIRNAIYFNKKHKKSINVLSQYFNILKRGLYILIYQKQKKENLKMIVKGIKDRNKNGGINKMKINFFLPGLARGIIGGYKIVYQYSNYLAKKGHDICIYYTIKNGENKKHIPKNVVYILKKMQIIGYPKWFNLNKNISKKAVKNFDKKYIRNSDVSIATAVSTAYPVYKLPKEKGKKFYLIQGYEKWGKVTESYLHNTYNLGMNNIVVSKWLKKIVDKYSKNGSKLIENGIDLEVFKINTPIEKRNPYSICMLYSEGEGKGGKYGIEIIKKLKQKYPKLEINLFSGDRKPKAFPEWINYKHKATEEEVVKLLNKSAIYMCTSLAEGFGLPGLEAMACGCALVTTNCFGIMEYANNDNAIISEPKDVETMYENIDKLLTDNEFRIRLAKKGNRDIQNRSLKLSEEKFENYLTNNF